MRAFPVLAAALGLSACGYIANPRPPYANVPAAIQALSAWQKGAAIVIEFRVPERTTEDRPIPAPRKLDVRIGTYGTPFNAGGWAAQAKPVGGGKVENGIAHFEIPSEEWRGKEAIVAARVLGGNGKVSNWSSFVVVPVVAPPERPRDVRASDTPQGVRVSWTAPGVSFRVFRRADGEKDFTAVANSSRPEWLDPHTDAGVPYAYRVETITPAGRDKEAESDASEEVSITPRGDFPPAAPSGLRAVAALHSIELSWEPNAEPFLSGYRVYRSTAGGPFEKIAEVGLAPAYSDHTAERGKTYRYAVTAVSKGGQESPRSEPAEAAIP